MLAEFLADQGDWTSVMPGARACLFSLDERPGPLPLQLEHLHFEKQTNDSNELVCVLKDGAYLGDRTEWHLFSGTDPVTVFETDPPHRVPGTEMKKARQAAP